LILLGVNIDHIATLRNARGSLYPSIATAAGIAEQSGADFITIHLREDQRHIKEKDLHLLKQSVITYLNLEMACNENVLKHAIKAKPYKITLVPERREEVTTEGGLDIKNNFSRISEYIKELKNNGIIVSLFIEPDISNMDNILKSGADEIEIHTGKYSDSSPSEKVNMLEIIKNYAKLANSNKLKVCAGHGLNYHNVKQICGIKEIVELNIGHSIISQALFSGLNNAVKEMKRLISEA
jgi:pyridoxine 5-phosphate synthase